MRGDPLHLCATGHQTIMYVGMQCPYCKLESENVKLRRRIQELEERLPKKSETTAP